MSFRTGGLATGFRELSSIAGWTVGGALLTVACLCGLWFVLTPSDAPHGGGILLQGLLLFGPLIGATVGLICGTVATARRRVRGEAHPRVGLF